MYKYLVGRRYTPVATRSDEDDILLSDVGRTHVNNSNDDTNEDAEVSDDLGHSWSDRRAAINHKLLKWCGLQTLTLVLATALVSILLLSK